MKGFKILHFATDLVTTAALLFSAAITASSVWLAWWDEQYFAQLPYDGYLLGFCSADPEHLVQWGVIATLCSVLFLSDLWKLRTGRPLPPPTTPGSGSFPIFGLIWMAILLYLANLCWTAIGSGLGDDTTSVSYGVRFFTLWNSYDLTNENIVIITAFVTALAINSVFHVVNHFQVAFCENKPA